MELFLLSLTVLPVFSVSHTPSEDPPGSFNPFSVCYQPAYLIPYTTL